MRLQLPAKLFLLTGALVILFSGSHAQSKEQIWKDVSQGEFSEECYLKSMPSKYRLLELDLNKIKSELNTALYDSDPNAFTNAPVISLPLPDGGFGRFKVVRSEVLPDNSSPTYSNLIRTFSAVGLDDKYAIAKLDYTVFGFHAMVMSPSGWFMIDPYSLTNSSHYISFYRGDKTGPSEFICKTENDEIRRLNPSETNTPSVNRTSGANLKTYRLALSCTGEYAAFYGGTQSGALSGMVTSVNRVTGVYELEVSVRLVLIANNSKLIFLNAATDPFSNTDGSAMLAQNQTVITDSIGSANYDIGHVFSTGGGGVAGLGVVCSNSSKARGVTGSGNPIGDGFDIDYVAHEMGHQFRGNHTFNGALGSCSGGNRNGTTAYEPGSGTTIMAYAGICGTDNTQSNSDPIFHVLSLDEILTFVTTGTGSTCPTSTATGNSAPVITVPGNYTIPYLTPFSLTGSATDVNGNSLTYIWEEFDLGAQAQVNATQTAGSTFPLFRDFTPQTTGTRVFPKMIDIVNNISTVGERLPSVARTLKFRFTARDNRLNGGAISNNDTPVQLTVVVTPDTFLVKQPNTAVTWNVASTQTVLWDVSGTDVAPISCANVNIYLSTDGGFTYPITLASNVPNTGSASVTVPNSLTTTARVKVEGAGNIFFDISNVNFSITPAGGILSSITTLPLSSATLCAGATVNVDFNANGTASAGNVYSAVLSGPTGVFSPGTTIGTLSSIASTGTITATIPAGTTAGTQYRIRVMSSNPPVTGSNNGSNLAVRQTVGAAGAITGIATVCAGQTNVNYSVSAVTNATNYSWSLPANATIVSGAGTNTISVTFAANSTSGIISVVPSNECFTGTASPNFNVTVNPVIVLGAITGSSVCAGTTATFSVAAVPSATSYNWNISGGTILTGTGTNSITANIPGAGAGSVTVSATNSCGAGPASSLSFNALNQPAAPTISASGPVAFCSGNSVSLSFSPVAGDMYQWRKDGVPVAGATSSPLNVITSGTFDVISYTKQIYTSSASVPIPDNSCAGGKSPIGIYGYTGNIPSASVSVSINITHTWDADLVVMLEAPNGQVLGLVNLVGSSGDNFTNSTFTDAGAAQIPSTGAPYSGTYKPWTSTIFSCDTSTVVTFNAIGGGSINPNGIWTLMAFDRANQDTGRINSWSLTIPASTNSPCNSISNSITTTVTSAPAISGFTPQAGASGQTVTISGSGFTGSTSVTFNGISAAFSVINDATITATVPGGATSGIISVITSCGTANSATAFSSEITLALKVLIEGYFNSTGILRSPLGSNCDSVEIRLASTVSPFNIIHSVKGVINSSGNGVFAFPGSALGNSYYIVVNHRNSLETWSGSAVSFAATSTSYDFSVLASQAFGNNQVQVASGKWAIRSGDLNKDGVINYSDLTLMQGLINSVSVGYQVRDITGDNIVESTDYSLQETNSQLNLSRQKP